MQQKIYYELQKRSNINTGWYVQKLIPSKQEKERGDAHAKSHQM
jgi:hypothetical protein